MLNKLTEIIREQTGDDTITINRDSVLLADLGMNSFDLINLVCVLEDEFEVEIPDRVIGNFKTVGDVMDYIAETQE
ncbi:MAG: acyl carrier protein [Clostridiales bacterium]|nr:acyl carrier protein [Clostridiales bacterium]